MLETRDPISPAVGGHVLDRPVAMALGTFQRHLGQGDALAMRFPAAIAPFGTTADLSPASFKALARLGGAGETLVMIQDEAVPVPEGFTLVLARSLNQMVGTDLPGASRRADLVTLGPEDAPEMMALVELTKPGPFAARTHELGTYLGVRAGGRLVAMAGERLRLPGFTEISAVCTHPEHRGHGHARALITALVQALTARGERPFLHVVEENTSAIGLYHELGFTLRRALRLTILRIA